LMAALRRARSEPCLTLCSHPASVARRIYDRWGWCQSPTPAHPARPPSPGLTMSPDIRVCREMTCG